MITRSELQAIGEATLPGLPEVLSAIMHKLHLALFKPAGRWQTLNPRDSF